MPPVPLRTSRRASTPTVPPNRSVQSSASSSIHRASAQPYGLQSPPLEQDIVDNSKHLSTLASLSAADPGEDAHQTPLPDIGMGMDFDWSAWVQPQTEDLDCSSLLSVSGHIRARDDMLPPVLQNNLPAPSVHIDATSQLSTNGIPNPSRRGESPGVPSRQDAATGLAMISLEAAAEPHYVGESSGSFWSNVVSQGMREPSRRSEAKLRTPKRFKERSSSPTDHHILRTSLQRQLSNDVAKHVLLTVYRHLHSRVRLT